jgi:hypothetical protein
VTTAPDTSRDRLHPHVGQDASNCNHILDTGVRCGRPAPEHDIEMMRTPQGWPQWPLLPLKRYDSRGTLRNGEAGFIIEQPVGEAKILYLATIFEVSEVVSDPRRQTRYESLEDIYADGWRVD